MADDNHSTGQLRVRQYYLSLGAHMPEDSSGIALLIAFLLVLSVIIYILYSIRKKVRQELRNLPDFTPNFEMLDTGLMKGVAIDTDRRKLCYFALGFDIKLRTTLYNYEDLQSFDIMVDGDSIMHLSRFTGIANVLDGLSTELDSLMGMQRSAEYVHQVDLRLTFNDMQRPEVIISAHTGKAKRGGLVHQGGMKTARDWAGRLQIILQEANAEAHEAMVTRVAEAIVPPLSSAAAAPRQQIGSIADELAKLATLRDQGILSDDEFQQQKTRLLQA